MTTKTHVHGENPLKDRQTNLAEDETEKWSDLVSEMLTQIVNAHLLRVLHLSKIDFCSMYVKLTELPNMSVKLTESGCG